MQWENLSLALFSHLLVSWFLSIKKKKWLGSQVNSIAQSVRELSESKMLTCLASGKELDWEPEFKRKRWQIIKPLNGKQRELPTITAPYKSSLSWLLLSVTLISAHSFECLEQARWEIPRLLGTDSTRLNLKRKMINCQMAAKLWSPTLLFVLVASYSSLSVS